MTDVAQLEQCSWTMDGPLAEYLPQRSGSLPPPSTDGDRTDTFYHTLYCNPRHLPKEGKVGFILRILMDLFNFPIPQGNIRIGPLEEGLQGPELALAVLGLTLEVFPNLW